MANVPVEFLITVQDANGDRALMTVGDLQVSDATTLAGAGTSLAALATALGAPGTITNGKVVSTSIRVNYTNSDPRTAPLPIDAEFPSVADKAYLSFATPTGTRTASAVPAPIEAVFHAPPQDDTVDPTSAIAAWITAVGAHGADRGGSSPTIYLGGVRKKSRARRRRTHRA